MPAGRETRTEHTKNCLRGRPVPMNECKREVSKCDFSKRGVVSQWGNSFQRSGFWMNSVSLSARFKERKKEEDPEGRRSIRTVHSNCRTTGLFRPSWRLRPKCADSFVIPLNRKWICDNSIDESTLTFRSQGRKRPHSFKPSPQNPLSLRQRRDRQVLTSIYLSQNVGTSAFSSVQ
jgi:hypothetical protein